MKQTIKTLSKCVREFKFLALLTPCLVIGEVAMDVVVPMLISNLIDYGITPGDMAYVVEVGLQLVVACVIALAFGVASGYTASKASSGFAKNLRQDMYYNVQNFAFSNIDKFSTPSIITRMTTDVTNVQMSFQMMIRICVRSPIMFIFAIIMVYHNGGALSLVFAVAIPVVAVCIFLIFKILIKTSSWYVCLFYHITDF